MNEDKNLSVRACTDTILLNALNCKKESIPDNEILARLRAVRHGIDEDFPDLPSPASVCSSAPSVVNVDPLLCYSQVVKGVATTPKQTVSARAASVPQPLVEVL